MAKNKRRIFPFCYWSIRPNGPIFPESLVALMELTSVLQLAVAAKDGVQAKQKTDVLAVLLCKAA